MKMGDIFKLPVDDRNNNDSGKEKTSIKFDIEDFKIIVFKSGLAFIILKTVITNTILISDVLDFNYRFKSILSKKDILKKLDNIEISLLGDEINGIEKLKQILLSYIGSDKTNKSFNNDNEFYTFSYLCVDNMYKNNNDNKNIFKEIYIKYSRILQSSYDAEGLEEETIVSKNMKAIKDTNIGITKTSSMLLCSRNRSF